MQVIDEVKNLVGSYGKTCLKKKTPLTDEMIKKFKAHLINKDFFIKLKLIMYSIDSELRMTRNGGIVSDDYIAIHKNDGELCEDNDRQMVTHDDKFKLYVK